LYAVAREADRLKDEFLAVLSHELRTPLNAILGYARLLRGGILSGEKAERGLDILERNATSLNQIVEDVLDISRIVSGKLRLDVQPVELPLVVVLETAGANVSTLSSAVGALEAHRDPPAGRPGGGSRHATHGRLSVHRAVARIVECRMQCTGGGADRIRTIGGSDEGAAQRLRRCTSPSRSIPASSSPRLQPWCGGRVERAGNKLNRRRDACTGIKRWTHRPRSSPASKSN
jgi:His Kinase A (phospho-acceptor) domain